MVQLPKLSQSISQRALVKLASRIQFASLSMINDPDQKKMINDKSALLYVYDLVLEIWIFYLYYLSCLSFFFLICSRKCKTMFILLDLFLLDLFVVWPCATIS